MGLHPAAPQATAPDVAAPTLPEPDRRPAPTRRRDTVAPAAEPPPRRSEATARLTEASPPVADTYARVEAAPREPQVAAGGTKTGPTRPEPHPLADADTGLATPARVEPRHRLHPITPLLRGVRILAIVIAVFSWQGYQQLGPVRWALGAFAVLAVALALAAISWLTTGYQVLGRELRISEGVLWRRTRAIPLERLQTVDVVRPMMARLAGVAELRLEVVGAPRAEAPLAYLTTSAASRLREHLLRLAGTPSNRRFQHTADRVVHLGSNGQVVLAHLMTPHAFFAPLILSLTLTPTLEQSRFTFVAIGSMLTATVGIVQVPIRRILDEWNFRLREDDKGLRLRHGLLSTRSQTVPRQRIQAVGVTWPLMWRPFGWLKARMDVAGYGHHDRDINMHAGVLLPVADGDTARQVLAEVLDADLLTLPVSPVPQRAKWLAPLRYRMLAVGHDREMVYARDGWLVPKLVIAPLARAQSVRVVQGPIQRLLGLADVHVDTAGRLHVVGEHRDADEAYALAATLASAARAARARELGAHHRSNTTATANANPT
jgi:putative membrane protein